MIGVNSYHKSPFMEGPLVPNDIRGQQLIQIGIYGGSIQAKLILHWLALDAPSDTNLWAIT
jgi:hypothetical protein